MTEEKTRGMHPVIKGTVATAAMLVLAELAGRWLRSSEVARASGEAAGGGWLGKDRSWVRLRDGRLLSYVERGDPDGVPVVYFHGPTGAGHEWPLAGAKLAGVRLLAPERPGYGGSEPVAERIRSEWVHDMEQWADQLGLERFPIVAWSVGCPYALNCAAWLRDRISGLDLISSPAPVDREAMFSGYSRTVLIYAALANLVPGVATLVARVLDAGRRWQGRSVEDMVRRYLGPGADEEIVEAVTRGLQETFGQGSHAVIQELEVFAQPWPFDLYAIRQPVTLWAGSQDLTMAPELSVLLREGLRGSELRLVPQQAHTVAYPLEDEILRSALRKAAVSAGAAGRG
jgi:pimeloyl-ACP methyl ester carboxylesterase